MDISSQFLNIKIKNPIIIASSPLSESVENILMCFNSGAGAVISKSCSSFSSNAPGFRRCYFDNRGFWATSTFDREIQDINTSCKILYESIKRVSIPIFASVTEPSLEYSEWYTSCKQIADSGVSGIQLDFFYLENLMDKDDFKIRFIDLLNELNDRLSIPIFPKLNINLPSKFIASLLKKTKVDSVALLDSISVPPPFDIYNRGNCKLQNIINPHDTSLFGTWQYPLTLKYTYEMVSEGFYTCSGGGIHKGSDVVELIMLGASVVQIATELLINGYKRINEILDEIIAFLSQNNFNCLDDIKSLALKNFGKTGEVIFTSKRIRIDKYKCTQCKRCLNQAFCNYITYLNDEVIVNQDKCEGCSFCVNLCTSKALYLDDYNGK